ncbi:MAG: agmatinase, partial [Chloroflexi bacterium]|nr:agmatinase [Chloroflexota bacterium]
GQRASRELNDVDVAIVGIPFDSGATSWRSGTRMGPRRIRENSLQLWGHNRLLRVTPTEMMKVVDYGDVDVEPASVVETHQQIVAEVGQILATETAVISLGGDHSITFPLLQAHAQKYGPVAVIHFDSHTDMYPGYQDHGTCFRNAIEAGAIDTESFIQVGIRGPLYAPDELELSTGAGVTLLTIDDCFEMGITAVIKAIRTCVGNKPTYVSLDIDAIDPAYAPGTGTPEVGGFTSYQMLQLVRGLQGLNLVGFDLVEVSPPYDSGEITSILGANLIFEFLSLLAANNFS